MENINTRILLVFLLAVFTVNVHSQQPQIVDFAQYETLSHSQLVKADEIPNGLTSSDWTSIQSQIQKGKYRAYEKGNDGFVSSSPAHGWQIEYGADGTTMLMPRDPEKRGTRRPEPSTGSKWGHMSLWWGRPKYAPSLDSTPSHGPGSTKSASS